MKFCFTLVLISLSICSTFTKVYDECCKRGVAELQNTTGIENKICYGDTFINDLNCRPGSQNKHCTEKHTISANICNNLSRLCCLREGIRRACVLGEEFARPLFASSCDKSTQRNGAFSSKFLKCCECCQLGKQVAQTNSSCTENTFGLGLECLTRFKSCCQSTKEALKLPTNCYQKNCSQSCEMSINGPICGCSKGYTLNIDGTQCNDINECSSSSHGCLNGYICINTPGTFYCQKNFTTLKCSKGYVQYDDYCRDMDECASGVADCPVNTTCENILGSYQCVKKLNQGCSNGFFESMGKCVDKNECKTQNPCKDNEKCINLVGSYKCIKNRGKKCQEGYSFDGRSCKDEDECKDKTHDCIGEGERCRNTPGSYQCVCKLGYKRNPYSGLCQDINECEIARCSQTCKNTPGSFICECNQGFTLHSNKRTCIDMNECKNKPPVCKSGQNCINGRGAYVCVEKNCPVNYRKGKRGNICYRQRCKSGESCTKGPLFIKWMVLSRPIKGRFALTYSINIRKSQGVEKITFELQKGNEDGMFKLQKLGFSRVLLSKSQSSFVDHKPFQRTFVVAGKAHQRGGRVSTFEYRSYVFFA